VRWATDVVWRRILTRAEVPHRPIGQCRHSFAVLALKQHKPLNWIQRQMGHRTLQMLLITGAGYQSTIFLRKKCSRWRARQRRWPQIMPALCPPDPKVAPSGLVKR
jgi:integrase